MRERTTAELMVLDLLVGTDGSGVRSNHRISVRTVQETRCTFLVIIPYTDTAFRTDGLLQAPKQTSSPVFKQFKLIIFK